VCRQPVASAWSAFSACFFGGECCPWNWPVMLRGRCRCGGGRVRPGWQGFWFQNVAIIIGGVLVVDGGRAGAGATGLFSQFGRVLSQPEAAVFGYLVSRKLLEFGSFPWLTADSLLRFIFLCPCKVKCGLWQQLNVKTTRRKAIKCPVCGSGVEGGPRRQQPACGSDNDLQRRQLQPDRAAATGPRRPSNPACGAPARPAIPACGAFGRPLDLRWTICLPGRDWTVRSRRLFRQCRKETVGRAWFCVRNGGVPICKTGEATRAHKVAGVDNRQGQQNGRSQSVRDIGRRQTDARTNCFCQIRNAPWDAGALVFNSSWAVPGRGIARARGQCVAVVKKRFAFKPMQMFYDPSADRRSCWVAIGAALEFGGAWRFERNPKQGFLS